MITGLHVKSGDDSLNGIAVISRNNICGNIGCGSYLVFQKLLKINTSQAIDTLYVYTKFEKFIIYVTVSLNDRTRWAADASRITHDASRCTWTQTKTIYPPFGGHNYQEPLKEMIMVF